MTLRSVAQTIVRVAERDAFGREIGEDTLKDMGWSGATTPPRQEPVRTAPPPQWTKPPTAPTPKPTPTPTPFDAGEAWSVGANRDKPAIRTATTPPVQRYQRRRRGSFSRLIVLMVVVVIVAGAGAVIGLGSGAVESGQRALRDAIPTAVPVETPPAAEPAASLYSTASVRKALAKLPGGRVTILSLRPDSLSATGKSKIVYMSADGSLTTVDSPTAIPGKAIKVDPAAPSRIARAIAKRTKSPIETMTLTSIVGPAQWNIALANGRSYTASANGRHVTRA